VSESARIIVKVTAGILAGEPESVFTRRYAVTTSEWESSANQTVLLHERNGQALGYAQALMAMPERLNWVRVDWLWL
jgi:hypothetical protein